ncbi:MAG: hypothetical protein COV67_07900 [Nitrospinae bacterium CG11_big_fil_rev_8_21_14_0_20_56_8]|nr:MAG: hypothetical protein COV67_07900 [Nitrospinae bacterium CG11_big_fil_rev_8_21_14_0_20_56_8]
MIKIPIKLKRNISGELKRFTPIIQNLKAKGTTTSEDDSRIILNDMLNDILGYDKYNELRTEQREKAGRLDYIIKLTEGPNASKRDKMDCVVEAKAIHQELTQKYIDQTLTYCLTTNTSFFILTNVRQWRLYKLDPPEKNTQPTARLIHEVDFTGINNLESMADDFYIFSRSSYLAGDWENVATIKKVTNANDIYTVLLSNKVLRVVSKILSDLHEMKVREEMVGEVIESRIGNEAKLEINKSLMKKLNAPTEKSRSPKQENDQPDHDAKDNMVEINSGEDGAEEPPAETENTNN